MMSLLRPFLFCALGLWALYVMNTVHAQDSGVVYADGDKLAAISDVLFKKNILSTDDPAAVEEYIRVHHCGMYEQYAQDDFAWNRIRETQARDLELKLPNLPEGLEISSGLRLTQYDMGANQFLIAADQQMDNMGLLTLFNDSSGSYTPCAGSNYSSFVPRVHPLALVMKLDKPVVFTGVPMSRARADELIATMNSRKGPADARREVTMVLRVRITGVDPLSGVTDKLRRTVLGHLDEILIYDGIDRKNLLFKKDLKIPPAEKSKS